MDWPYMHEQPIGHMKFFKRAGDGWEIDHRCHSIKDDSDYRRSRQERQREPLDDGSGLLRRDRQFCSDTAFDKILSILIAEQRDGSIARAMGGKDFFDT